MVRAACRVNYSSFKRRLLESDTLASSWGCENFPHSLTEKKNGKCSQKASHRLAVKSLLNMAADRINQQRQLKSVLVFGAV